MKHIKKEMANNHLQFVSFEATDFCGVSRFKSILVYFFQEKVINGVYMPQGYLELTPNPKDSEMDHIREICFNSDIVLMPNLSTFRVSPWAERTARLFPVLCLFYNFCVIEIINSKTISFPASTLLNNRDQPFLQELGNGLFLTGAKIESFSSSTRPEHKMGSANPYLVLTATAAAGLDGLQDSDGVLVGPDDSINTYHSKSLQIPLKLEDALVALEEDQCL
ncbi:Lengsin [Galemys pyrenaicus]|uniref:Lengsin n=1 Tax=Galemys pyrenaicus TaxID=202257 RepID=A0A8J6DXD4_GALPY|nr:Lengsin [Galemys pyrenaicus]